MNPSLTRCPFAWALLVLHTTWVFLAASAVQSGVLQGELDAASLWYLQFYVDLPVSLLAEPFQRLFCILIALWGKNPSELSWLVTNNLPYALFACVFGGCQYYAAGCLLHSLFARLRRGRMQRTNKTLKVP
jgi:hypothetical protein